MERGIPDGGEDEVTSQSLVDWTPNETHMRSLVEMGFTEIAAKKGLFYTGNISQEAAIEWIFANPNSFEDSLETNERREVEQPDLQNEDDYKMVFVVNSSLQMQTGKIAAQVAHAALGVHRLLLQNEPKYGVSFFNWSENGETKVVLRGDSTVQLIDLETRAIEMNLACYLVHDAGRTQVAPGSTTVLGIFGAVHQVDSITGSLRLL